MDFSFKLVFKWILGSVVIVIYWLDKIERKNWFGYFFVKRYCRKFLLFSY